MSDKLDTTIEIGRDGLLTTIVVKEHAYDTIEFTIRKYLRDEKGKEIINSGYTCFFSPTEFKDFFQPLVNDLKVRFDHADSIQ